MTAPTSRPQFSLRGMLIVISLFAVSFGLMRNAFYDRSLGRALFCFVAGSFILAGTIRADRRAADRAWPQGNSWSDSRHHLCSGCHLALLGTVVALDRGLPKRAAVDRGRSGLRRRAFGQWRQNSMANAAATNRPHLVKMRRNSRATSGFSLS